MKSQDILKYILLSLKSEVVQYKNGAKKMGKTKAVSIIAVVVMTINALLTANGFDGEGASAYISEKMEGLLLLLVFFGVLKDDKK